MYLTIDPAITETEIAFCEIFIHMENHTLRHCGPFSRRDKDFAIAEAMKKANPNTRRKVERIEVKKIKNIGEIVP